MRLFGLIGFPLSHSFSAQYFTKKFAEEHISDAGYSLFPLEYISQLTSLLNEKPDLLGFNITIPHKVTILPYLHNLNDEAAAVGAINCVRVERNSSNIKLYGYNTDVYGFRKSLTPLLKPYHQKALILGTGGAAKAVCFTLNQLGIFYKLVSRSGNGVTILNYSQLTAQTISNNLLIINTTPVGMYPNTENCPDIPYQYLSNKHLLYDLIYNPVETKFLKSGRDAGADTVNGLKMLEFQAEKSWEIWNK